MTRARAPRRTTLRGWVLFIVCATFWPSGTRAAQSDTASEASPQLVPAAMPRPPLPQAPLDAREPPFSGKDFSWLNGNNHQPDSLLKAGPTVLSLYVDAFYAWQFNHPIDHTIFPTTTAPRHNEIGFNLASLGIELPPNAIDSRTGGPVGQLSLVYGAITETIGGQDMTVRRGFFLSATALQPIRTASAGWHFHALHGINVEFGIFPSHVALESYLPEENWNYTHPFVSDFTPYYFFGGRAQVYPTADVKLELWVVNGWQTYGQWNEGRAGGYLLNWRPTERFSVANVVYVGQEEQTDPEAVRYYTDNYAQLQYFKRGGSFVTSSAVAVVADVGYEARSLAASGPMTGYALANRTEFGDGWAFSVRGDIFYDKTRAITTRLPLGSPYTLPDPDSPFLGGGVTTTLDYWPSPWLVWRLEYIHRAANVPFFSGPGGITGNGPDGTVNTAPGAPAFTPDLRRTDDRIVGNVTLRL
jgi:putative OmpL-like beta-barrel porin-2